MADTHVKDANWETDLIWHYFHVVTTKAEPRGSWYRGMDPLGELSIRHRVYEILVDDKKQTAPATLLEANLSKIPWNQTNADFIKSVGGTCDAEGHPDRLWCGSIVKIAFTRYMGWTGVEPKPVSVGKKGFNSVDWVIKKLQNKIPVRAGFGGHHYVGIVGHRYQTKPLPPKVEGPLDRTNVVEFLCLEPWPGGVDGTASVIYAGSETRFLGIIQHDGLAWKYGGLTVTSLEA